MLPSLSSEIDYEAELGVVIGERARDVPVEPRWTSSPATRASTTSSARDLQFSDGQWTRAKSLDTFSPTGPRVVPASEIPDPQALRIRCLVNGEALQDSSTAEMVFSVAELISYVSHGITLEPGDLIVTGTRAGVGFTRTPPIFLRPGDEVDRRDRGHRSPDQSRSSRGRSLDGVRAGREVGGEGGRGGERPGGARASWPGRRERSPGASCGSRTATRRTRASSSSTSSTPTPPPSRRTGPPSTSSGSASGDAIPRLESRERAFYETADL